MYLSGTKTDLSGIQSIIDFYESTLWYSSKTVVIAVPEADPEHQRATVPTELYRRNILA